MDKQQKVALKHSNKLGAGASKRKHLQGQDKVEVVMHEFKRGTLHSGSGDIVSNPKQAIAIALHEAGLSKYQKKSAHGSGEFSKSEIAQGYKKVG